jgi:ketosteroid isomerase-like protein
LILPALSADSQIVEQMWEEIAGGLPDTDAWETAIERWWHPQLVYEEDPKWPGSGSYQGRNEVRAVFEGYAEVLGTASFSLERVAGSGEKVVALVRVAGNSAAGVPWDHLWGYLCRTREGQLEYMRAYWDPDEALGVAEGDSSP